jgi:hypothetical protein
MSILAQSKYDPKTYVPPNALKYLPMVKSEAKTYAPGITIPWYFGSLIEQESCISLRHSRCWSPESELNTKRELGLGFGQLTKAYNQDGSIRFDALEDLKSRHKELRELSWSTFKSRPDLQIRSMIVMIRTNYNFLSQVDDPFERLAMSDAAYNGGLGGLNKERITCNLAKGCDSKVWFGNVEKYCMKSKAALYGTRSACDINREHVTNVMYIRLGKYEPYFR